MPDDLVGSLHLGGDGHATLSRDLPATGNGDTRNDRACFAPVRPFHAALLVSQGLDDIPPAGPDDDPLVHGHVVRDWMAAWSRAHWSETSWTVARPVEENLHPWMAHKAARNASVAAARFRREAVTLSSLLRVGIPVLL